MKRLYNFHLAYTTSGWEEITHINQQLINVVTTLALGSWPRQRFVRARAKRSVRECENENSHSQVSSHFGSWSFGLPNLQRAIVKVKTPRKVYYIRESGGFPRIRAVVSLVSSRLLVACPSTKGAPTLY